MEGNLRTIYHITTRAEWNAAAAKGAYSAASLASEGFVHFSRAHQVLPSAARYFHGAQDLVLLEVCEEKVAATLKYEGDPERFPHLYGALNFDAVLGVHSFTGKELPTELTLVGDAIVRAGKPGDEAEIAMVHTYAWQQSYRGLMPDAELDSRHLAFRGRMNWHASIVNGKNPARAFVAESKDHGIVGFVVYEPARDTDWKGYGEIAAIYCLQEYKRKGLGATLLRRALQALKENGHRQAYLWTSRENRESRAFYERMDGRLATKGKTVHIGSPLAHVAYVWDL